MFASNTHFNRDISEWDVSAAELMDNMFFGSTVFDQNLCRWGEVLDPGTNVINVFGESVCPDANTSISFERSPPGPFCHPCIGDAT